MSVITAAAEVSAMDMTLEQFVHEFSLPRFAKVTQGYDDPNDPDNEFSTNDLIKVLLSSDWF